MKKKVVKEKDLKGYYLDEKSILWYKINSYVCLIKKIAVMTCGKELSDKDKIRAIRKSLKTIYLAKEFKEMDIDQPYDYFNAVQ